MITQEMVDAIRDTIRDESGGHALTNMVGDKLWWTDKPVNLTEILRAVYPLILEQAARAADFEAELANKCSKLAKQPNAAYGHIVTRRTAKRIATAIRNLKDKTDEAHNG